MTDVIDVRGPDRIDAPEMSMAELRGVDDVALDVSRLMFVHGRSLWTCVVDAADAFDDRACVCDVAGSFDDDRFDDTMASQMYDRTCVLLEPDVRT